MYFDPRLFAMTVGLRGRIALATLVGLVAVPVAILRLTLTGRAIARVFEGESLSALTGVLVLIASLIVLRGALQYLKDEIAHATAALMKVRLRRWLYEHVLRLGPGHFDQQRTGDAVLSLVEGVEQLDVFFGQYLPQIIIAALTPLIIFAFMAFLDVRTAFIFLVFALFTLFVPALFHRMNRSSSLRRRTDYAALGADFLDGMQGLTTLKTFGQSRQRGALLAERARRVYRSTMWVLSVNLSTGAVTLFGISAGAAIALAWGAARVESGDLELRTLLVVLLLGVEVFRPLRDLTVLYHQGMVAMAATRGIYDLLDTPPEVREAVGSRQRLPTASVRFEHVTFGYQGGRRPALSDLSFELKEGETLGVVGPSGAGKSTIVNLLLRFVDPQQGRVLLGGQDVRELPFGVIRANVALVAQDTYLFYGTVAENLRLGKPDATATEMEQAARAANAHDFITALPQGYDTVVGERGVRLSGGQRQRIAIARALLKDAPILVLDEALSSVDAENEAVIREALERLQRGRTTLVIAHRLSSVVNAHRIIVLERGRLVESGTHAALMAAGGAYARLMAAQHEVEEERQAAQGGQPWGADGARAAALDAPERAGQGNGQSAPAERAERVDDGLTTSADAPVAQLVERGIEAARPLRMTALWRRLLALVGPWWWEAALTLCLGLAYAAGGIAIGVIGARLVGQVFTRGETTPYIVALLIAVPVTAVFNWLDVWIAHDLAFRLLAELRIKLYQLLDPLAPAYLQRRRSGDLVSAATGDIELIELFYAHTIAPLMIAILVPGGVLVTLFVLGPPLALALIPFIAAVALTPLIASRRMECLGAALREQTGSVNAFMVDSIQGLRTIAAFGDGERRTRQIEERGRELSDTKRAFLRQQALQGGLIEALIGFGGLAVLATGAGLVVDGRLARTDVPLATLLAISAFGPVVNIVTVAKELMQTVAAARRYFAIEDEPVPVRDGPGVREAMDSGQPVASVVFEEVTFRYAKDDRPALSGVSFAIPGGQTVALVGRSGAGKTTAAHLLLRFWDPQAGRITIGGHDLREFELDELRSKVALVAQDTYLFNATLMENLRLGRPGATDADVFEAARRANVEEFASALPDGYETLVGERGMQLSGGQRQRVAIARALLKDAPILVLDEATSHLDAVNEAEVRRALDQLMAGRTTLVIAHRLSTIRDAHRIVALDEGRVVEMGTHQELLARDGLYSHLIASQLMVRTAASATSRWPVATGGDGA